MTKNSIGKKKNKSDNASQREAFNMNNASGQAMPAGDDSPDRIGAKFPFFNFRREKPVPSGNNETSFQEREGESNQDETTGEKTGSKFLGKYLKNLRHRLRRRRAQTQPFEMQPLESPPAIPNMPERRRNSYIVRHPAQQQDGQTFQRDVIVSFSEWEEGTKAAYYRPPQQPSPHARHRHYHDRRDFPGYDAAN